MRDFLVIVAFVGFTVFSFSPLTAQQSQHKLDSLANVTRSGVHDTLRLLTLGDLCYEYRLVNQDSALKFGKAGIELGKKVNHQRGLAQVLSDAAFIYYDRGDYDSAVSLWTSALDIRSRLKDKARTASLHLKIGGAQFRQGSYEKALQNQLKAVVLYEELGMAPGVGQALNNIAAIYQAQNQLDQALTYYTKAFKIHVEARNKQEIGSTTINIGNVHFLKKSYADAKAYYQHALDSLSDHLQPSNYAICLNNLSEIYVVENRMDSARYYSREALQLREKIGDAGGIISSLNMLGRIETKWHHYSEAEIYLAKALRLAREKQMLPEEGRIQFNLYELFLPQGDYRNALAAHVRFAEIRDSLLSETSRKEVASLQVKYETDKKEQQIRFHEASLSKNELQLERNRLIILVLLVTLVLLLIIFVLLRNRQRRKVEIARKQNEISVREAYIRATIESQENERKRFARDLHDGMGQWLSSLRLSLAQIQKSHSDDEKVLILDRAEGILNEINVEFRGIAFNLMPQTLIHNGLIAAVQEMVLRLNSIGTCHFYVASFGFPVRLAELMEISLYRVIQEWTNNIIKYSLARRVNIQFTGHADELIIMMEDDGAGFDTGMLNTGKGNGWKNIQSRVNLVKGIVEIDSRAGLRGTTFTVRIPRLDAEINGEEPRKLRVPMQVTVPSE